MALIIPGVNIDATFANGDIINGVAHFVTDTKPTQRIPTTDNPTPPLVTGDRWYKPDDGTEWFWNGTYWIGNRTECGGYASANVFSTFTGSSSYYPHSSNYGYLITKAFYRVPSLVASPTDTLTIAVYYEKPGAGSFTIPVITFDSSGTFSGTVELNSVLAPNSTAFPFTRFTGQVSKTGSPTYGNVLQLTYFVYTIAA